MKPLIAVAPEYPAGALLRGLKGHVDVEFTVNSAGRVENAHVVTAQPKGVFDSAALAAVQRRRYAEDPARAPQVVQERFDFQPPRPVSRAAALATSGPRNQCVRQDAVYNYGETVDVGLINACDDALVVFGCAQGTGRNVGRWVCSSSEERGEVLVGAGDQRIGKHYAAGDAAAVRTYTYTDTLLGNSRAELRVLVGSVRSRATPNAAPMRASGRVRSAVRTRASIRRTAAPSPSRAPTEPARPRRPPAPGSDRISIASAPITITTAFRPRVSSTTRIVTSKSLCAPATPATASNIRQREHFESTSASR